MGNLKMPFIFTRLHAIYPILIFLDYVKFYIYIELFISENRKKNIKK